jgi:hypothetical protein
MERFFALISRLFRGRVAVAFKVLVGVIPDPSGPEVGKMKLFFLSDYIIVIDNIFRN